MSSAQNDRRIQHRPSDFSFPGGRWFHFTDPSGNELAVWSDKEKGER